MEQKAYTFVKNVEGGLTILLDSYNMQLPTKWFSIPYNAKSIIVPFPYAMGLFISSDALSAFNMGYFTIDNYDELKAAAQEIGLCPEDAPTNDYSNAKLGKIIDENDIEGLKDALNQKNNRITDTIIALARTNYGNLSNGMVRVIEDACGAELGIE